MEPSARNRLIATLHSIDPAPLLKSLSEQGIDENMCRLDNRFYWLEDKARRLSWIHDGVDWLIKNRSPEPERLAVCHDDFHPLNILIQDGEVTGVLDWPGFLIADPALDVANAIELVQYPPIVRDLIELIRTVTEIEIAVPEAENMREFAQKVLTKC